MIGDRSSVVSSFAERAMEDKGLSVISSSVRSEVGKPWHEMLVFCVSVDVVFLMGFNGLSVDYLWNIFGLSMDYLWTIYGGKDTKGSW